MPPCSDMSAAGLSRYAHLADGRLHLVLVRGCTVLQYLQFLSLIPSLGADLPLAFPHSRRLHLAHGGHWIIKLLGQRFLGILGGWVFPLKMLHC